MNPLISFASEKHPELFSRGFLKLPESSLWLKSPLASKFVWHNGKCESADPNTTTMVSGMCCVRVTSLSVLKNRIDIRTEMDFMDWYASWYPRLDQVHDGIGIPPAVCKKMIYVVEDYIHAQRIVKLRPEWNVDTIAEIIKTVHQTQGHSVVCDWVKNYRFPYTGTIECIFLSDILREAKIGIRIAKKFGFKNHDPEKELLKFMYTSLWPEVLGVQKDALLCEPIKYIQRYQNHYDSILDNIPIIGFLPYLENYGIDDVPHVNIPKHDGFISYQDRYVNEWLALNIFFNNEEVIKNGPKNFDITRALSRNNILLRLFNSKNTQPYQEYREVITSKNISAKKFKITEAFEEYFVLLANKTKEEVYKKIQNDNKSVFLEKDGH